VAARSLIHFAEAYAYHATWLRERPDDYGAEFRARVTRGRDTIGTALVEAQVCRARFGAAVNEVLQRVDVLVAPTTPTPAWPFGATDVTLNGVVESYSTVGLRLTVPFTAFGGPALSVPCGLSAAGLPVGLQVAGRRFDEAAVLRVGHAYEQYRLAPAARSPRRLRPRDAGTSEEGADSR